MARDINRDIVLELIRFRQPISRVDLSRASGLQPSTISAIAEELLAEGWIREGAVVQGARGRPSTMLAVNDDLPIGDLGYDALRQFRFQIDPVHHTVTFQPLFRGKVFRIALGRK